MAITTLIIIQFQSFLRRVLIFLKYRTNRNISRRRFAQKNLNENQYHYIAVIAAVTIKIASKIKSL